MAAEEAYRQLIESDRLDDADRFVVERIADIGYSRATWHLWRFQRYGALEPLRISLVERFHSNEALSFPELELLFYLQERLLTGNPEKDGPLCFPQIALALFGAAASPNPAARERAARLNLVHVGEVEPGNPVSLPAIDDPDITGYFGHLDGFGRRLLELAILNRCTRTVRALCRENGSDAITSKLDRAKGAEFYIGPYFFQALDEAQKASGKIDIGFQSPFPKGLTNIMRLLMNDGWQVIPYWSQRGGLSPDRPINGVLSFTYHSHGSESGRWHYKFGHFSDLMHVDPAGYAGYSAYSRRTAFQVRRDTLRLSNRQIDAGLEKYRQRYLQNRFSWRQQEPPQDLSQLRGARTYFVPLQDPLDEVRRLAFLSPAQIFSALKDVLHDEDRVLVKRHPVDQTASTTAVLESLQNDERFIVTTSAIHDLFAISDVVITVNSGVGFEALLAGLPVVLCGWSDYNLATATARDDHALKAAIENALWPSAAWRARVLYHYFEHYALDPQDDENFTLKIRRQLRKNRPTKHLFRDRLGFFGSRSPSS